MRAILLLASRRPLTLRVIELVYVMPVWKDTRGKILKEKKTTA